MRRKITLLVLVVTTMLLMLSLKFNVGNALAQTNQAEDILNNTYPQEQAELKKILENLYKTAQQKDFDKVRAYHAYSPKFTDFKFGQPRADSEMNKQSEEDLFTSFSEFIYDLRDIKVAVYDKVAITTFHGYFTAVQAGQPLAFNLQSTLVFAKIDGSL